MENAFSFTVHQRLEQHLPVAWQECRIPTFHYHNLYTLLPTLFPTNTATSHTHDSAMLYKNFSKGHSHNAVKNTILLVISTETQYNKDGMSVVGETFNTE
jgi:hypothetical protein